MVSQPDKPAGRGQALRPPPVKVRAQELGIPVFQPTSLRSAEVQERIVAEQPVLGFVVAYGKLIPPALLCRPPRGYVNAHASLLPRWRGAAPIAWSILEGDPETGVCLMQMEEGLDTGPVLAERRTAIASEDSSATLGERLSHLGAALLQENLPLLIEGALPSQTQAQEGACYARMLRKEDGRLRFRESAEANHRRFRAMDPWPGAYAQWQGKRIKLHRLTMPRKAPEYSGPEGSLRVLEGKLWVKCSPGYLSIEELQPEGKRRMSAAEFLAGRPLAADARFDQDEERES